MRKLGDECGLYLSERALTRDDIWALDGDLADSDGAEWFSKACPSRFIQAGIAEQCMVSAAAGMAACGVRPWVFSFAAFLCYRGYDQIRVGVSQTGLPVTLVGSHAGGCGGRNGKTHLALNDISVISSLPNIDIWSPSDRNDIRLAVDSILSDNRPAYLRLPRTPVTLLPGEAEPARWIGARCSTALVTHGLATHWGLEVQAYLQAEGIEVGILHIAKVWPISPTLEDLLNGVKTAIVLEDHSCLGGVASLLTFTGFAGSVEHVGWPASWSGQSGSDDDLRRVALLTTDDISARIRKRMTGSSSDRARSVA